MSNYEYHPSKTHRYFVADPGNSDTYFFETEAERFGNHVQAAFTGGQKVVAVPLPAVRNDVSDRQGYLALRRHP